MEKLLHDSGFPQFESQKDISLTPPPYSNTTPDLYYEDVTIGVQVAIYLDGLSKAIHGNKDRQRADHIIRSQLEARGIDVLEIATSDLNDPVARNLQLQRIASKLRRSDLRDKLTKGE